MSKASDELRKMVGEMTDERDVITLNIADRIDAEMIELPRDKDGKPIHVGDMLRGCDAVLVNVFTTVVELRFNGRWEIETTFGCITEPRLFVHDSPDSLERIADELDEWKRKAAEKIPGFGLEEDALHALADRIRKLDKERNHE